MIYKQEERLSKERFQNPDSSFRGAPFWAWNTKMTRENIDYTLEALKDMGMGGGFVHCRTGMDNPYMGEEFLDLVAYSNEKSKEMNMLTWLYDEDRWPSGAGGGLVTKDHQYRVRFLVFAPWRLEGKTYEGKMGSTGQAVRSEERTLLGVYDVKLENGYLADYKKREDGAETLPGYETWYAYLEVSGDNHWFNDQAYLNTLDKKAVERFIEVTHEKYYEKLGDEFGKSIHAMFTDEPQFCHKTCLDFAEEKMEVIIPWTDDFEDTFQATYQNSMLEALPELFWELPDDRVSVNRYHYHDHIAERFASAFADTVGDWCKEKGIALTGHMMEEPTLETQTAALGEAMRSYRSFTIPGVDMLADHKELSTAKQTQSAVHQFGYEGMASELYGVTNWDFDFRGHKLQGDWQAALGVTLRVPHLTWTSMGGEAKRDYPAAIGYQSPWYKEYTYVEDYFARLNTALTRGVPHVRVGVIHPIESYWLLWGPKEQTVEIREEMDEHFLSVIKWMLFGTIDFDFIAESLLPDLNKGQEYHVAKANVADSVAGLSAEADGGDSTFDLSVKANVADSSSDAPAKLKVGEMNYDVILVPGVKTLRSSTLEILEKFKANGGRIVFAGELPEFEDAMPSNRGKNLAMQCEQIPFSKTRILGALKKERDIMILEKDGSSSKNLIYQMRQDGDNRWLFLAHVDREIPDELYGAMEIEGTTRLRKNVDLPYEENLTIRINGEWKITQYDALTGEIKPLSAECQEGNTILKHTMYDQDSLLVLLEPCICGEDGKCCEEEVTCGDAEKCCEEETVCCEAEIACCEKEASCCEVEVACCEKEVACCDLKNDSITTSPGIIPAVCTITRTEPNVSILDLAEYRFDDEPWQAEDEILRIDNLFREKLGYPLRMEALAQPWTMKKDTTFEHMLELKHTIETDADLEGTKLAMEYLENAQIFLDGAEVENKADGWYTDRSLRTIPLPTITQGTHELHLKVPYNTKTNVEVMFLLGEFMVEVKGRKQTLHEVSNEIAFADITRQGMPFYGGNLIYEMPITTKAGTVTIETSYFRAPALRVTLDEESQIVAYSPYQAKFDGVAAGEHNLKIEVFGNRVNTFGTVHNCNRTEFWYGPNSWRTTGVEWSYEYQLRPTGLLKAPVVK